MVKEPIYDIAEIGFAPLVFEVVLNVNEKEPLPAACDDENGFVIVTQFEVIVHDAGVYENPPVTYPIVQIPEFKVIEDGN